MPLLHVQWSKEDLRQRYGSFNRERLQFEACNSASAPLETAYPGVFIALCCREFICLFGVPLVCRCRRSTWPRSYFTEHPRQVNLFIALPLAVWVDSRLWTAIWARANWARTFCHRFAQHIRLSTCGTSVILAGRAIDLWLLQSISSCRAEFEGVMATVDERWWQHVIMWCYVHSSMTFYC